MLKFTLGKVILSEATKDIKFKFNYAKVSFKNKASSGHTDSTYHIDKGWDEGFKLPVYNLSDSIKFVLGDGTYSYEADVNVGELAHNRENWVKLYYVKKDLVG